MEFESFALKLDELGSEKEADYLIELLFQITIGFRAFNDQIELSDKGLKQFNEINHRVLNRFKSLANGNDSNSRVGLLERIKNHISKAPEIAEYVNTAMIMAHANVLHSQTLKNDADKEDAS